MKTKQVVITIIIFVIGVLLGVLIQFLVDPSLSFLRYIAKSGKYEQLLTCDEITQQVRYKEDTSSSGLPIDSSYFNQDDLIYKNGEEIAFANPHYTSYPTELITVKTWENRNQPLKYKSLQEITNGMNPQTFVYLDSEYLGQEIINNYKEFGEIASNYLPEEKVISLEEYDIDDDGQNEKIVRYEPVDTGNGDFSKTDVIKNENIIFTGQSKIIPAKTTNGFYLIMGDAKFIENTGRCCPTGHYQVRFVWEADQFRPIYQQEVYYLKTFPKSY